MTDVFNFQLSEIITEDKLQEYLKIGWEALSDGYKKSGKEVDIDSIEWKRKCEADKKSLHLCEMDSFADRPKIDKGILLKILGALREHIINKMFKRLENELGVKGRNEYFAAGSTNITSDYDLSVSGPEANEIMWLMFKTFLHHYKASLPYAFDSNLYSAPLYIHTTIGSKLGEDIPSKKLSIREKSPATGMDSFSGFPRVDYDGHGKRQFTLIPQTDDEINEELDWAGIKLLHKSKGGKYEEYDEDKTFFRLDQILNRSIKLKEHLMNLCEKEEEKEDYKAFFKDGGEFAFLNPLPGDEEEEKRKKKETILIFKNYWMQYKAQEKCQKYVYKNMDFKEEGEEGNPVLETVNGDLKRNIFYYSNKANYFSSEAYYTSSAVNTIVVENQLKRNLNYRSRENMIKCKIAAAIEQIGDMTHHIEHKKVNTKDKNSLKKIIVKFSKYIYRFWYILGSIGERVLKEYEEKADEINKRIIPIRAKYDVERIKEEDWKLLDVTWKDWENHNNEENKKEWLKNIRHNMLNILEDVLEYNYGNTEPLMKRIGRERRDEAIKMAAEDFNKVGKNLGNVNLNSSMELRKNLEADFQNRHNKLRKKLEKKKMGSSGGKKRSKKKKRKKKRKKTKRKN